LGIGAYSFEIIVGNPGYRVVPAQSFIKRRLGFVLRLKKAGETGCNGRERKDECQACDRDFDHS
jgi:hypothetical protein